jgi:phage-related protein (TIGR01555 family)
MSEENTQLATKEDIQNAVGELTELRNSVVDLMPIGPGGALGIHMGNQISQVDSLYLNNRFQPLTIQRVLLAYMYMEHGIIQTAIDQPVQDAFRGGIEIESEELDQKDIKDLQDFIEEKDVLNVLQEAIIWKRLFGGSAIIINMDVDPSMPFRHQFTDNLEFYAADRWELSAWDRDADYFIFYGTEVHKSRIIQFMGKKAPSFLRPQLQGWGMSEVERMVRDLNAYFKNKNVIFELLDEAKVDIYKIARYANRLLTRDGIARLNQQIQTTNAIKNFQNALIMDKEDEYDHKEMSFSGLADIIKENRIGIACALKMPITKLFGLSSTGFNSGEDDLENYNSMVESEIRTPAKRPLKKILGLCANQLFGFEPDMTINFKPLRVMTDGDEEAVKTSKQARVMGLYNVGWITAQEGAQMLRQEKILTIQTAVEKGLLDDQPMSPGQGMMQEQGGGFGGNKEGGQKGGQPPASKPTQTKTGKTQTSKEKV